LARECARAPEPSRTSCDSLRQRCTRESVGGVGETFECASSPAKHVRRFPAGFNPAGIAGNWLGYRRIRRCSGPAGAEEDDADCQNEEARDLATSDPRPRQRANRQLPRRARAELRLSGIRVKVGICRVPELRVLVRRGFDRRDELKCCTRPGIRSRPQPAAVRLDNQAADRQSHSGALRLGRNECTEDLIDPF